MTPPKHRVLDFVAWMRDNNLAFRRKNYGPESYAIVLARYLLGLMCGMSVFGLIDGCYSAVVKSFSARL
jgi:hypothetical protein